MRKILLMGAGFFNKGAEAMLRTVQDHLSTQLGGSEFCIRSEERKETEMLKERGIVPLPVGGESSLSGLWTTGIIRVMKRMLNCNIRLSSIPGTTRSSRDIETLDAALDISGFSIGDKFGEGPVRWHAKYARLLKDICNLPIIYMPQSWGSFENPVVGEHTRKLLNTVDYAFARDRKSLSHLQELGGISEERIGLSADIAFHLESDEPAVGMDILTKHRITNTDKNNLIGIVPNMRVYERMDGEGTDNRYVRMLSDSARYCVEELGARVVLMPHEYSLYKERKDDTFLCDLIAGDVKDPEHVFSITDEYPARTLKSIIGQLDLLISSRYHSLIAAMSHRVPAVSLGWAHKYVELFRDAGLEEYVMDLDDLDDGEWISTIGKAWENRKEMHNRLESNVPSLEASSAKALEKAVEIIRGGLQESG